MSCSSLPSPVYGHHHMNKFVLCPSPIEVCWKLTRHHVFKPESKLSPSSIHKHDFTNLKFPNSLFFLTKFIMHTLVYNLAP